jgi:hypothetical protein
VEKPFESLIKNIMLKAVNLSRELAIFGSFAWLSQKRSDFLITGFPL